MHRPPGIQDDDTMELLLDGADAPGAVPDPRPEGVPEARPVFVDASGRRHRRVRRWGYLLTVPALAYVALLASTLLGGPTIEAPFLPSAQGPRSPEPARPTAGATSPGPTHGDAKRVAPRTAPAATRAAAPSPRPGATAGTGGPTPTTPPTTAPPTAPTPTRTTGGPTARPTPPGQGRGRPTSPPGQGNGKPTAKP
ncbi:hypothetical protein [Streptomyces sp. NPDC101132]|uniref:hypothetical protein n=1 Tax=Streptomyces sp. NPDC101132 TaxID=3366110 RepID=UPI0038126CF5